MSKSTPLNFKGFEINRLVFEKPSNFLEGMFKVNVQHINHINLENKNIFSTEFIINIDTDDKLFNLQVQALSHFEIMGDVTQEIYDNYINISAPSIAYPYLRAFISNVVIQTGMKPIIIPPLNFAFKLVVEPEVKPAE